MMKLYIVRVVTSKRVIGLFWCDFPELIMLVDEEINPVETEYCRIDEAATLRWGRRGPKVGVYVPYDYRDEEGSNVYCRTIGQAMWAADGLEPFFGDDIPADRWDALPTIDRD